MTNKIDKTPLEFFSPKRETTKGGHGSGNWGHGGLPGVWGGSGPTVNAPSGGGASSTVNAPSGGGGGAMPKSEPGESARRYSQRMMKKGKKDMATILEKSDSIAKSFEAGDEDAKQTHLFSIGLTASMSVGFRDRDLLVMAYSAFEDSNMSNLCAGLMDNFGSLMPKMGDKYPAKYANDTGSALSRKYYDVFSPSDLTQIFSVAFSNSGRNDIAGFLKRNSGMTESPTIVSGD